MTTTSMLHLAAAIALAAALISPPASAAQPASLTPGARVRISAPDLDLRNRAGKIVRATEDSVTIDFRGRRPPVTMPIESLSRMEVSTGKRSRAGLARGVGIGLLIGAAIGSVIASALSEGTCADECQRGSRVLVRGGGVAGAVLGGVIGVATAPDRWEEVSLRREASASGMVRHHPTTRVGLTISF